VSLTRLVDLQPELILSWMRPEACTELESLLSGGITEGVSPRARVVSMHADTMKQVLSGALRVGRCVGRAAASMQAVASLEMRLKMLRDRVGLERTIEASQLPSVALLERLDPPAVGARWIEDVIELAGGRSVCARIGMRSEALRWDALRSEDPDVLALAQGGTDLAGARRSIHGLSRRFGWGELAAVRAGRVFLFDGRAYFNRPGPRLYRSIELMAAALFGARAGVDAAPHEMAHPPS
jgi:iron complex transport system substrate-binding protein